MKLRMNNEELNLYFSKVLFRSNKNLFGAENLGQCRYIKEKRQKCITNVL